MEVVTTPAVLLSGDGGATPLVGESGSVVALGNFDGVHLGHRAIIAALVGESRRLGVPAVALTFDPLPLQLLRPEQAPRLLTTLPEKSAQLAALGVDMHVVVPFTRDLAALTPDHYVDQVLVPGLRPKAVFVGFNHTFGKGAAGNPQVLTELCHRHGIPVVVVGAVSLGTTVVSSSAVRTAVEAGAVEQAAQLLGRPFSVWGTVVHGDQRGRTIGVPTANVALDPQRQLPMNGVYAVRACTMTQGPIPRPTGPWYGAMANLGLRPTVGGHELRLEVHLFDLDGDLYGQTLAVQFYSRLRGEQRFPDLAALKAQLAADAEAARSALARAGDP